MDNSPPSDLPSEIYSVVPSPPWVNVSGFVGHQVGGRILGVLFPIPGSAMKVPFCSGYYLPLVAALVTTNSGKMGSYSNQLMQCSLWPMFAVRRGQNLG